MFLKTCLKPRPEKDDKREIDEDDVSDEETHSVQLEADETQKKLKVQLKLKKPKIKNTKISLNSNFNCKTN